jgi:hypothetical protein
MRRTTIGCIVACLAMLVPTVADASKRDYAGKIDPSGTVSFTLRKKDGQRDILQFAWQELPVKCNGKPYTTTGRLDFAIEVRDRKFKARGVLGDHDKPKARAVVKGKLKGKRRAVGTIEVDGSRLPTNDNENRNCESGLLDWKASR